MAQNWHIGAFKYSFQTYELNSISYPQFEHCTVSPSFGKLTTIFSFSKIWEFGFFCTVYLFFWCNAKTDGALCFSAFWLPLLSCDCFFSEVILSYVILEFRKHPLQRVKPYAFIGYPSIFCSHVTHYARTPFVLCFYFCCVKFKPFVLSSIFVELSSLFTFERGLLCRPPYCWGLSFFFTFLAEQSSHRLFSNESSSISLISSIGNVGVIYL
jgi:hypothetical protein